jgi:hypothetical protein
MSDADKVGGEPPGPGHEAARVARSAVEEALFALAEFALAFDRHGLRDRLLRAIELAYVVLDSPVIAAAHLDGLGEAGAVVTESAALLARAGDPTRTPALGRALERLSAAAAALRAGAEAVAQIQLQRRSELVGGDREAAAPPASPFRASRGLPELHAPQRRPLLPHVVVDPTAPLPEPAAPAVAVPKPTTLAELQALQADALSGALTARLEGDGDEDEPPPPPEPLPFAYEPAVEETEILRRLARDCLEDIANLRALRKPNVIESWLDQAPFEQRLLDNVDAFAALGGAVLPQISLFHAEAKAPDPARAFATALTLGCIAGHDTVGAAVMTLKQSAPETFPGWLEGLCLAPNPAIDAAIADLAGGRRADLAALALDVLHARGRTPDEVVTALLDRAEPEIASRVARALAGALPREDAIEHLERLCAAADDDVFLAAVESLLRRGHGPAGDLLRRALDARPRVPRGERASLLLCLVGRSSDLERLLALAREAPTARLLRGLGRFGHVDALGPLCEHLEHEDADLVQAAAEALDRITGAGLRETVEEAWEVELPPEAADAGGIAVPTHKVERIAADPAQWAARLKDQARHLDAKVKTRGGAPFVPLRIVEELEARATPPHRRAEAALELALVTGIATPFSPDDWVARQKRQLTDLRADVEKLSSSPGAWSGAARRSAAEEPPLARPAEAPGVARLPEAQLPLPALATPNYLAPREPAKLPVLPAPPHAPPAKRPQPLGTMIGTIMPPGPALPFAPGAPTEPAAVQSLAPMSDETQPATLSPLARPVLPFAPVAPSGAPPAPRSASPGDDGDTGTMLIPASGLERTAGAVLPFHDGASAPEPRPKPRAPSGSSGPTTAAMPVMGTPAEALPFRSAPQATAVAKVAATPPPALTLQQYASLCAELAVFRDRTDAVFHRYGLGDPRDRPAVDRWWQEQMRGDADLYQAWQALYRRWTEHFEGLKQQGL